MATHEPSHPATGVPLKHTLKSYAAAVKQLQEFKAVLPISTRNSESSAVTPKNVAYSSNWLRSN